MSDEGKAEQERKDSILAEYFASGSKDGQGDEEDEADFDPSDDGEESDPFEGGDDDEDDDDDDDDDDLYGEREEKKKDEKFAVLDGTLHFNDDGDRLVYSGTWSMQADTDADNAKQQVSDPKDEGVEKKKKKTKFKLKSKQAVRPPSEAQKGEGGSSSEAPIFDLEKPTVTSAGDKDEPDKVMPKRTMLFDGFFVTSEAEGNKKIKERDVELTFSSSAEDEAERIYDVTGRGTNEFGVFTISGTYYACGGQADDSNENGQAENAKSGTRQRPLVCSKRYRPTAASSPSKGGYGEIDESEDISGDEGDGADFNELIALNEEATMSVEELRRRYYGGGEDDDGGGSGKKENGEKDSGEPPAKKARAAEPDSDDDGCGF